MPATPARALGGPGVELRPVTPADVDWLYGLLVHDQGLRWRYRGRTPSPATFATDLWHGVHSQYVAWGGGNERQGIVGLFNANQIASHCHFFAVAAPGGELVTVRAGGLLIDWAFSDLGFDKLWIEAPEFNLQQFESLRRIADVEGHLKDFDYWRGRYWAMYILSIQRERWVDSGLRDLTLRSQRRRVPAVAGGFSHRELKEFLSELWPIDSLGAVELMQTLEDRLGDVVESTLIESAAGAASPDAAATFIIDAIGSKIDG